MPRNSCRAPASPPASTATNQLPFLVSPPQQIARPRRGNKAHHRATAPSFLSPRSPSAGIGPAAAMGMVRAASFLLLLALLAAADARRQKGGEMACDNGWECSGTRFCCNETITDYFKAYQFEELFAKRNDSLAHAAGFWNYEAFITAAALFEPRGFGTTGGREMGMKEVAAFLGHVGAKTSCGYSLAAGGSLAWGLCYNHEMSPSQSYCDDSNELYRCAEGVEYYGRGALPVYWNYNYGIVGKGIKQDLLNHLELLEQNATLAFEAAIWRCMTPMKRKQPSAHDAFVGNWKPTKKDTL